MVWASVLPAVAGAAASWLTGNSAAKSQKRLADAQTGVLNQQAKAYNDYGVPGLKALWEQYTNPDTTGARSAMASAEAGTARDLNANARLITQALRQRGLGGSSFEGSAIGQLGAARGDALARERVNQGNVLTGQRNAALAQLLGYATGAGNAAAAGYGNQSAMYGQQADNAYGDLAQIAAMYLNGWYGGAMPPQAGTSAGTTNPLAPYAQNIAAWLRQNAGRLGSVVPTYGNYGAYQPGQQYETTRNPVP